MEWLQQHAVGNRTIQKRLGTGQGEMQLKSFLLPQRFIFRNLRSNTLEAAFAE